MQMVLCLPVETEKEGDEGYCFSLATRSPCSKYVDHHTKTCNKMNTQSLCVLVGVILVSSWCHPVNLQSWNVVVLTPLSLTSCLF